jgi:hypothetical protein
MHNRRALDLLLLRNACSQTTLFNSTYVYQITIKLFSECVCTCVCVHACVCVCVCQIVCVCVYVCAYVCVCVCNVLAETGSTHAQRPPAVNSIYIYTVKSFVVYKTHQNVHSRCAILTLNASQDTFPDIHMHRQTVNVYVHI